LTSALFWLLHLLHDNILFDWGLAIIALVVIVRTLLHPITKWSQIRIQKFGKQMQELAPKQKKIQEKYGHDKKRMQEEMQKLWREEGIDPSGLVGCFPMLLQTPIWIALFAMLYFAIELRHAPAFFGVFQHLTNGNWRFLADLAQPDRAIFFGHNAGFQIPLLGAFMGNINAINVLPLLLGFVFFIHQKYMTPQSTTTLSPEQETQQKMMKVMMVVLFPLFMYNMPSGLVLYSITNSTIAIFESRYIRSHVKKLEEKNPDMFKKKRRTPRTPGGPGGKSGKGGFLQRLQEAAEQRRAMMEEMRRTGACRARPARAARRRPAWARTARCSPRMDRRAIRLRSRR
jgi:YidC/Oxa1 family membrane protein insertase